MGSIPLFEKEKLGAAGEDFGQVCDKRCAEPKSCGRNARWSPVFVR
jgi:hypothetical protein